MSMYRYIIASSDKFREAKERALSGEFGSGTVAVAEIYNLPRGTLLLADSLKSLQSTCEHVKCFSGNVIATNPPIYPWICRKCGTKGKDRGTYYDTGEYERLVKEFREEVNP